MNRYLILTVALLFAVSCSSSGTDHDSDVAGNPEDVTENPGEVLIPIDGIDVAEDVVGGEDDIEVPPVEVVFARSENSRVEDPSDANVAGLTAGNRDFGWKLYQKMREEYPGKNLFLSPHSISLALAMAYAGAVGDTAREFETTLGMTSDPSLNHEAFNALDLELSKRGTEEVSEEAGIPFELSVVNAAWGQEDHQFLDSYLDVLAEHYGAGMGLVDFFNQPEESRVLINDWVAWQTRERIKDLLPEDSISNDTALVLTNVIYFKANWLQKFDEDATKDAEFSLLNDSKVTVPMMEKTEALYYKKGDDYQLVEMSFTGGDVVMVLILPEEGEFADMEARITKTEFDAMREGALLKMGKIRMPKFSFEFEAALNEALKAMGIHKAFCTQGADFSGIDGIKGLFISLVQHKTFIGVDELGAEAAAATAVVTLPTSAPSNDFEITFDRPFLFAIVDKPTGAPLFVGSMLNPAD